MPIKYVPFVPEPIEGQAVLKNFNRILKYKGADDTSMVLERDMKLKNLKLLVKTKIITWLFVENVFLPALI